MCSAKYKEQQQEMIKDCYSDDNDDNDCSGSGVSDMDGSCIAKVLLLDNQATKSSSASGDKKWHLKQCSKLIISAIATIKQLLKLILSMK